MSVPLMEFVDCSDCNNPPQPRFSCQNCRLNPAAVVRVCIHSELRSPTCASGARFGPDSGVRIGDATRGAPFGAAHFTESDQSKHTRWMTEAIPATSASFFRSTVVASIRSELISTRIDHHFWTIRFRGSLASARRTTQPSLKCVSFQMAFEYAE